MTGWGAHGIDQVQWALGMDESGPVEIWTEGVLFHPPTYATPEARGRGERSGTYPQVVFRYANGVNYWEENRESGQSDGRTTLHNITATPHADFSARFELDLKYHVANQPSVLIEHRVIGVSSPSDDGQ